MHTPSPCFHTKLPFPDNTFPLRTQDDDKENNTNGGVRARHLKDLESSAKQENGAIEGISPVTEMQRGMVKPPLSGKDPFNCPYGMTVKSCAKECGDPAHRDV
jgi:hypothetical protein